MKKNDLLKKNNTIIRILETDKDKVLVIDCTKLTMPKWIDADSLSEYNLIAKNKFHSSLPDINSLSANDKKLMHERYTLIAGVLPFIDDINLRSAAIKRISLQNHISCQTIRKYLCLYLAYQSITALLPSLQEKKKELTKDEKNMRWALNKFYYTKNKNSLKTAYTYMLKEKYCTSGQLADNYPTFNQFRYFYRKHKKLETFYISRNGLKNYQRNNRPLTGNGIQEFAPSIGVGMLDSTICDIYLVNYTGNLVGRPILTACIDAYSSFCYGYSLSWEGGMYSVKNLLINIVSDKVEWCKQFGISIAQDDWNISSLPAIMVTDMGSEYKSETFEQITEHGIKLINLPAYRPELKGAVEKFFDIIQELFKPTLKGKGVIEPDFRERGAHDYRKDACLTMQDFEKIIIHCILYYNTKRIISNFPYAEKMLDENILPYASCIWNWSLNQTGTNLVTVTKQEIYLTLLPRANGRFSRLGLSVNNLRYYNDEFTEAYLSGSNAIVAYDPNNVTKVWVVNNGEYTEFELIENRFENKSIDQVHVLKQKQHRLENSSAHENLQARIELLEHIKTISEKSQNISTNIHNIRNTRKHEQDKQRMRNSILTEVDKNVDW